MHITTLANPPVVTTPRVCMPLHKVMIRKWLHRTHHVMAKDLARQVLRYPV